MKLHIVNKGLIAGCITSIFVFVTGCQSGNNTTNEKADSQLNQTPSLPEANQPIEDTIHLEAKDLVYLPPNIHVQAGQDVIFEIKNNGEKYHSMVFVFPQDSIKLGDSIPPGGIQIMKIQVPSETGNYEFYCPLQNHKSNGMRGELIVEKATGA